MVFALSGGAIPLPLTAVQILAIDLGTETLPAARAGPRARRAGRDGPPAAPPGRAHHRRPLLVRAWLVLGATSALLVMAAFACVLLRAGWRPGGITSAAHCTPAATTATFLAIVVCQVGTAFAARCDSASLRSIGPLSNPWLLGGIAFELAFAAALTWVGPLQDLFGTAPVGLDVLAFIAPFPGVVWGVDECAAARNAGLRRITLPFGGDTPMAPCRRGRSVGP